MNAIQFCSRSHGARSLLIAAAAALVLTGCSEKPEVRVTAPDGNWVALFNGKDLDGWTVKIAGHDVGENYQNTFRVEDGLLKATAERYDQFGRQFGSLFYNREFSHYWLRAEYRFAGEQASGAPSWAYKDSGIQLHCQSPQSMRKDQEFPVSVELNLIGGRKFGKRPTGDVCRNGSHLRIDGVQLEDKCSSSSAVTLRNDDWVTVEVEVDGGRRIRHVVNGVLTADYSEIEIDDADPDARGLLASRTDKKLERGFISLQSNSHPIEFRKIEILPLD